MARQERKIEVEPQKQFIARCATVYVIKDTQGNITDIQSCMWTSSIQITYSDADKLLQGHLRSSHRDHPSPMGVVREI